MSESDCRRMVLIVIAFVFPRQKFLFFVLKSSDVLDILVPILYYLNDARADQCESSDVFFPLELYLQFLTVKSLYRFFALNFFLFIYFFQKMDDMKL